MPTIIKKTTKASKLIEVVANFSEGRDEEKIHKISRSFESHKKVKILNIDSSPDANRTVLTFAAEPEYILGATLDFAERVFSEIDMSQHKGVHPRIGALDVCPFVPLVNSSIEECRTLAESFAKEVASRLQMPVYLYKESAKFAERKILSNIRKGEYEGLKEKLKNPSWKPDYGPDVFNPRLGAIITGAREILIAWNICLEGNDVDLAKKIAKILRHEFKGLRAIGWSMEGEHGCSQISCNVENYKITPLFKIYERASEIAKGNGSMVSGSELIGLAPHEALFEGEVEVGLINYSKEKLIEHQLAKYFI